MKTPYIYQPTRALAGVVLLLALLQGASASDFSTNNITATGNLTANGTAVIGESLVVGANNSEAIQIDTAAIPINTDGPVVLAQGIRLSGLYFIFWETSNRIHDLLVSVSAYHYSESARIDIISENVYSGQPVIKNLRVMADNGTHNIQLVADVSNRTTGDGRLFLKLLSPRLNGITLNPPFATVFPNLYITEPSHFGSIYKDYFAKNQDSNYTLRLNALDNSSIGFHDSGQSMSSIRYSNSGFVIGGNDGWGVKSVTLPSLAGTGTTLLAADAQGTIVRTTASASISSTGEVDITAAHVKAISSQGNSAFFGRQDGGTFWHSDPIFYAVSDNNSPYNYFFRGKIGGINGTETFSVTSGGAITAAGGAIFSPYANKTGAVPGAINVQKAGSGGTVNTLLNLANYYTTSGVAQNTVALDFSNGSVTGMGQALARIKTVTADTSPSLSFDVWDDANGLILKERLRIAANGNVGIGTSSPQGKLDIFNATNSANVTPLISIRSDFNITGNYGMIRFGDYTQSTNFQKGAIIYESVASSARGKLHLALENTDTPNSVSLNDAKLTVLSSGNVGIGTKSPKGRFVVESNVEYAPQVYITKSNNGSASKNGGSLTFENNHAVNTARANNIISGAINFNFSQPTSGASQLGAQIVAISDSNPTNGQTGVNTATAIVFKSFAGNNTDGSIAVAERMRIASDGVVTVKNKIRVPESGDLSMGDFRAGVVP